MRKHGWALVSGLVLAFGSTAVSAQAPRPSGAAAEPPLIPRQVLFGNPDRVRATLSPDGTRLAFLAAHEGVLNVFVGPAEDPPAAKPVTSARKRGILRYQWAHTGRHILFLQDRDGDENWHVYCTDLQSGATIDLTPFETIPGPDDKPLAGPDGKPLRPSARIVGTARGQPTTVILGVNNRDPRHHDLYRADLLEGTVQLMQRCPEGVLEWVLDNDLNVRYALAMREDGGQTLLAPKEGGQWETAEVFPFEDALSTWPIGFTADHRVLYMQDSRGRDTAALFAVELATGKRELLAEDPGADLGDVLIDPTTRRVQAASFGRHKPRWTPLEESVTADLRELGKLGDGVFEVVSRSDDDKTWLILVRNDDGPNTYHLLRRDRAERRTRELFADREALRGLELAEMRPVTIAARDGLELVSYLTLPVGAAAAAGDRPARPLPTVLLVHGGPWARDEWGFNSMHQLLANRGYAVLSVNFRGSTGFGKSFLNAARMEWGGKMHDDLIDAVQWAIKERIADPERIAIYGGSYGGYAALVGLTFTPETFACGVAIVGPSNLVTLLETIPEYWKPALVLWRTRVGDIMTEEGREFLRSRSPLTFVDRIRRPLLIGHGANDPRVKQAESDQIVRAMQARNIPVTYVLFPDEGHGFARPENRLAFTGIAEAFLAQHLGGRYEPLDGSLEKSSAEIPAGAEQVPGLK
jgi:dipeptidyl aminopeptidase/acylaminoacyl peptidase